MVTPILDSQAGAALNGVAEDSRSLDKLRQLANKDPAKAVKQVATQFEALFMQMVLKSMRDATPKSGLLDSSDQQMYTSMLDEQLAQKIATGGTGLADVIARQLSRNLPQTAATNGEPAAPDLAAPVPAAAGTTDAGPSGQLLQTIRAAAAVRGAH
ncbi:Flagellar rod assembly protein/muramidase FlgJ (fragment) [Burkholderiales bacterium]